MSPEAFVDAAPEVVMAAMFIWYLARRDKSQAKSAASGHEAARELAKAVGKLNGNE